MQNVTSIKMTRFFHIWILWSSFSSRHISTPLSILIWWKIRPLLWWQVKCWQTHTCTGNRHKAITKALILSTLCSGELKTDLLLYCFTLNKNYKKTTTVELPCIKLRRVEFLNVTKFFKSTNISSYIIPCKFHECIELLWNKFQIFQCIEVFFADRINIFKQNLPQMYQSLKNWIVTS